MALTIHSGHVILNPEAGLTTDVFSRREVQRAFCLTALYIYIFIYNIYTLQQTGVWVNVLGGFQNMVFSHMWKVLWQTL